MLGEWVYFAKPPGRDIRGHVGGSIERRVSGRN
jgi:hypothetical protein